MLRVIYVCSNMSKLVLVKFKCMKGLTFLILYNNNKSKYFGLVHTLTYSVLHKSNYCLSMPCRPVNYQVGLKDLGNMQLIVCKWVMARVDNKSPPFNSINSSVCVCVSSSNSFVDYKYLGCR